MSSTCPKMLLDELKSRIARIEQRASHRRRTAIPLGIPALDRALPGGGLALGALHEIAGIGAEVEHGAAAGLFPERVIYAEAGKAVLPVMEEALRQPGLAGVAGEVEGRFGLTASRRLQLAAEQSGTIAFALRRSRAFQNPALSEPSASVT